ncbi:hypothetical protein NVP1063O_190 [Vibrio phage 1.063.O._10N.261.45.C7]|nr:hypothetical protein NVP1063O_190 [Vibrio phage 1.063.O._10N.261.45.C7]
MGRNLTAGIYIGVPEDEVVWKEGLLEELGIAPDEDDLVWEIDRKLNIKLERTISYDDQEFGEGIIGIQVGTEAGWVPTEVSLTDLEQQRYEVTLELFKVFDNDVDIRTFIVPSYL